MSNYSKYIFYILIFIIFAITRSYFLINENEIINIEFKSLAIANCAFPFGIIKETILKDCFLPFYYFFIHFILIFTKNALVVKTFNTFVSLLNIFMIIKIGKKILNRNLGFLLAFIFCINHYFLYYSNLIAPYCVNFLFGTILIKTILDFIDKPNKKHTNFLILSNCLFILSDSLSFLYVIPEFILLYVFFEKRKYTKKNVLKVSNFSFIAFLITFIILIVQYFNYSNVIIPNTYNGIGFNLNSLYLMINEFISPYLSFDSLFNQTKSTLGMLYGFNLNPTLKNINSVKILITLFYGSILPLLMCLTFIVKSFRQNFKLRFIFSIAGVNFLLILIFMLYETIDVHPCYLNQFFITILILLGYGIYSIKDRVVKYIIVFCFIAIQFINPDINSFNLTINKNHATIDTFNTFIKEYDINQNSLIIMPYMGNYAKLYYDNLSFFNFDYSMLQKNNKNSIIRNLCNKETASINKKNINRLINNYLLERNINGYLAKYFIENTIKEGSAKNKVIIFVDKLNTKPISKSAIAKIAHDDKYTTKLRKISFKTNMVQNNKTKTLYDAIKSKTLYNFINLANEHFYLEDIVQYKKIDNEYFQVEKDSKNIQKALSSYNSDYVFIVFKNYR